MAVTTLFPLKVLREYIDAQKGDAMQRLMENAGDFVLFHGHLGMLMAFDNILRAIEDLEGLEADDDA